MSNKVKDINIKKLNILIFQFFILIFQKSYKKILIYYIGCVTIKDSKYVKNYSVNPLYLICNKVNGYFEEININKYLMLVPTNESKKIYIKI